MKIASFVGQKGGVGKSTLARVLAVAAARPRCSATDDAARRASRVRRHAVVQEKQGRGIKVTIR